MVIRSPIYTDCLAICLYCSISGTQYLKTQTHEPNVVRTGPDRENS